MKHTVQLDGLSSQAVGALAEFLRQYYFASNLKYLAGPVRLRPLQPPDEGYVFTFGVRLGGIMPHSIRLAVMPSSVEVAADPQEPVTQEAYREFRKLADGIELMVRTFLVSSHSSRAYFVFSLSGGRKLEQPTGTSHKPVRSFLRRIMRGNAMNLFLFFLLLSFFFVVFLGDYALLAVMLFQSFALLYSDRLALALGSIHPSRQAPDVSIVSVQMTPETAKSVRKRGWRAVRNLRNELQDSVSSAISINEAIAGIQGILLKHGVATGERDVRVTEKHVFSIVERAAGRFGLPAPKVVISNTQADNASAMGISPGRSTITITAGALEDLNDEELESVIGHEIGHIKGRDPLILFALTFLMYAGGFYLWMPLLLFLGFFYFVFAFAIVFLVGKFLETRADTESANAIGRADMLASALTNISFRQLYYERYSTSARVFGWLRFDPHPPTYFRVQRLYRIAERGVKVEHTFLSSTKDCIKGFFSALAGL